MAINAYSNSSAWFQTFSFNSLSSIIDSLSALQAGCSEFGVTVMWWTALLGIDGAMDTMTLNDRNYGDTPLNYFNCNTNFPLLLVLLYKTICSLPRGERVGMERI